MKNSNELCLPLSVPYACNEIDSQETVLLPDTCTHYFAELLLIGEGKLRVDENGEIFTAGPGDAVMICPFVPHAVEPVGEERMRMTVIRMDPERMPTMPLYMPALSEALEEAKRAKMPMLLPAEDVKRIGVDRLAAGCLKEMKTCGYGFDHNVNCALGIINMTIIRFWQSCGLVFKYRTSQKEPIYQLTGYIHEHLQEGLRVEDLANRCGLSYPWFAKRFRQIYGIGCKDFIEQVRISLVERYLLFTNMDLTEISELTGYADCSHMIKNFKRIKDITPGQYRLKVREETQAQEHAGETVRKPLRGAER